MSAARRPSSTTRRTLLTATAAGTLLAALWFVPSANATQDGTQRGQLTTTSADSDTTTGTESADSAKTGGGAGTQLADTGSFDTTPYVVGGTVFLCVGAGFVTYSVRRERMTLS